MCLYSVYSVHVLVFCVQCICAGDMLMVNVLLDHHLCTSYVCVLIIGLWKGRDETANFVQKHDVEIIKDDKRSATQHTVHTYTNVFQTHTTTCSL